MGVGLGLITGSGLRWLAPQVRRQPLPLPGWLAQDAAAPNRSSELSASPSAPQLNAISGSFHPKAEIKALSARWRDLAGTQKDLRVSAYLLMLDDGQYAQLNANRPMPAASSIKTPILMAALERIDSGERAWNEPLMALSCGAESEAESLDERSGADRRTGRQRSRLDGDKAHREPVSDLPGRDRDDPHQ